MFTEKQKQEIVDLLIEYDENTKVYLGCDSVRYRQKGINMAKYATVCIVHMNGKNGCKIFKHLSHEPDYDMKSNRPKMRMMNEVRKVCELYLDLAPLVDGYDVEIHLDISTDPKQGSNCAASEAAGYVLGVTQLEPKLKPESFAASFGADAVAHGRG